MRRSLVLFMALLSLLTVACTPAGTPAPTAAPPSGYTAETPAAANATAEVPATTAPAVTTPAATPDIDKVLHPQPEDHKRGPDGAPVTIIEWGDFQ